MEKALVINEIFDDVRRVTGCKYGCNPFKTPDAYQVTLQNKLLSEKQLSERLSSFTEEGYEFIDGKIFKHNLYEENEFKDTGFHGVYRYSYTGNKIKYKAYFGPMIMIEDKKVGCKSGIGCGGIGCSSLKGIGCSSLKVGCKSKGCKNLGCKKEGGDIQYLNFRDNDVNQEVVKKLNEYFNIIRGHGREYEGYEYFAIELNIVLSELIKDNYDQLLQQYEQDITQMIKEGYGYKDIIDLPSESELYTQALLFASNSREEITFSTIEAAIKNVLYLHKFDLWYFPRVVGLLRKLWESFLRFLHLLKKKEIISSTIIEPQNIEYLEKIYTEDFNAQIETHNQVVEDEKRIKAELDKIKCNIPVTIAKKCKRSWLSRLFKGDVYDFYFLTIPGINKNDKTNN